MYTAGFVVVVAEAGFGVPAFPPDGGAGVPPVEGATVCPPDGGADVAPPPPPLPSARTAAAHDEDTTIANSAAATIVVELIDVTRYFFGGRERHLRRPSRVRHAMANDGGMLMYFDGCCKGPHGPGGYGVVLTYADTGVELARLHGFTGYRSTCNQAEWSGCVVGMAAALQLGCERLTIRGDSQLVIRQLSGRYRVNAPNLKPYHRVAKRLEAQFKSVKGEHVPRARNALADKLSNDGERDRSKGVWDLERFEVQCEERGVLPRRRA